MAGALTERCQTKPGQVWKSFWQKRLLDRLSNGEFIDQILVDSGLEIRQIDSDCGFKNRPSNESRRDHGCGDGIGLTALDSFHASVPAPGTMSSCQGEAPCDLCDEYNSPKRRNHFRRFLFCGLHAAE